MAGCVVTHFRNDTITLLRYHGHVLFKALGLYQFLMVENPAIYPCESFDDERTITHDVQYARRQRRALQP